LNLLTPQVVGSNFQFEFLTASGSTYEIQYVSSLSAGGWQTYTNIMGDGTLKPVSVPLSLFNPHAQGFVRVLIQAGN
jgi:hypothetical protein